MVIQTYDENGNLVETREEEGEFEPTEELKQIPQEALDALADKLQDPTVNSIAELKNALGEFFKEIK